MNVRFMNLSIKGEEQEAILKATQKVMEHGILMNGPELDEFEALFAQLNNRKYCVGVGSGTMALYLAIKALGLKSDDEIITTSLSWIATSNAIYAAGVKPVFADIDEDLNIAPESIKKLITKKTKAIIPVHFAGRVCKMEEIVKIAQENNLVIIEDSAQAVCAKRNGQVAGSFGKMACFSLNPMKLLGGIGEAGAIVTDDEELVEQLKILRYNGMVNKEVCIEPSINGRMDTLQAAVLIERLKFLDNKKRVRREIANRYSSKLAGVVDIPLENSNEELSWYSYTIKTPRRDELKNFLESKGIETKIQHPILMPKQKPYEIFSSDELVNAQRIVKQILCIPASEILIEEEQDFIVEQIKAFFKV